MSQVLHNATQACMNGCRYTFNQSKKFVIFLKDKTFQLWERWQPTIDRLINTSIAITATASTIKLSIQILPIVLSILTVLATAPFINAIMPAFFLNKTVIFFSLVGISAFVGYSKFQELVMRAKLDELTRYHQRKIRRLNHRLTALEQALNLNLDEDLTTEPALLDQEDLTAAPILIEREVLPSDRACAEANDGPKQIVERRLESEVSNNQRQMVEPPVESRRYPKRTTHRPQRYAA